MEDTPDIETQIAALRQQLAALESQRAVVDLGNENDQTNARITMGDVAGRDIVRVYLGREPHEDEQRALGGYLHALSVRLRPLLLRGLAERLDERGRRPDLSLVYTILATQSFEEVANGSLAQLASFFGKAEQLRPEYSPEHALPDAAITRINVIAPKGGERVQRRRLLRSRLASEAVAREQRIVLLGDPGSGKTTFLRHLAWALAVRGLGGTAELRGWDRSARRVPHRNQQRPAHVLPVILSLHELARQLVDAPDPAAVVRVLALAQLSEGGRDVSLMDTLLGAALDTGAALLLCDGLDEVPAQAQPTSVARAEVMAALRTFVALYPNAHIVVTCRTRAYDESLAELVDWSSARLAPWTMGQIRHLVAALYDELVLCEIIPAGQQTRLRAELLEAVETSPRLLDMARTPLLLTLMALVLVNRGVLPHDRPLLYERVLDLLLGQWDKVRDGETLAEAIGQADWDADRLAPLINMLSYGAHRDAVTAGERGGIARNALRDALITFFEQASFATPMAAAERCLSYFEQRSGLLVPDETHSYTFAHLTLQEHCAGRYLISLPRRIDEMMDHRGDDRWREPIFLGLGLTQRQTPYEVIEMLRRLLSRNEHGDMLKATVRWQRDLIFAAELAEDRRWERLAEAGAEIEPLQNELRDGLVALLDDHSGTLPLEERIRAGYVLGHLGDPRPDPRRADYWCRIPAGWVEVNGEQIWVKEFEIAKYPVTWGEWERFIEATGGSLESWEAAPHPNEPMYSFFPSPHLHPYPLWVTEDLGVNVRYPTNVELIRANADANTDVIVCPIGCDISPSPYGLMDISTSDALLRLARDLLPDATA